LLSSLLSGPCRGNCPLAEQYLQFADKSKIDLVEAFKSMPIDEEQSLENGDTVYEDEVFFMNAGFLFTAC